MQNKTKKLKRLSFDLEFIIYNTIKKERKKEKEERKKERISY